MGILQEEIEGDIGSVPRCGTCGSERVARDAWGVLEPRQRVVGARKCVR